MHPFCARRLASISALSSIIFSVVSPYIAVAQQQPTGDLERPLFQVNMQTGVPVRGDFQVGPTRITETLNPGEEKTVQVEITNRQGKPMSYSLTTEDFSAGSTEKEITRLYGTADGPFSARKWIVPAVESFKISHGERAYIPVTIRIPEDAEPGDHYAALMVQREAEGGPGGGFTIISRVGVLFLITVRGEVVRNGRLISINSRSPLYWSYPIQLRIVGQNDGTVHMAPTGTVQIRNILGLLVDEMQVKDWIVLRSSIRPLELSWTPRFALGRYTATTNLKIFGEQIEALSTSFWVLPLLPILTALLVIFLVSFIVQFFFSRFEITRKK